MTTPLAFVASCGLAAHRSRGARDRNTGPHTVL